MRGETGEQGLNSMNFQSVGMFPWMQQRVDPTVLRNDLNQQYQAILAAGLQHCGSGDLLKDQLMQQFQQQPAQYLHHSGSHNPLLHQQQQQQQVFQPSISSHMLPTQTQMLSDNLQRQTQQQVNNVSEEHRQRHNYQESFLMQRVQLQQRQPSDVPSPSFTKSDFTNSNSKFAASIAPGMQNMLGSLCSEESGNHLSFSRPDESILKEQSPQQSWVVKFSQSPNSNCSNSTSLPPYSGNDTSAEQGTCSLDAQNHSLFGANIENVGLLLPTVVSSIATSSGHAEMSSMQLGTSGFQSPLYRFVQDSSELLHNTGQVDQPAPTRTFVKVLVRGCICTSKHVYFCFG